MPDRSSLVARKERLIWQKIGRRKDEIGRYLVSNVTPVTDIEIRETPAFEKYADAIAASGFRPIAIGDVWGGGVNGWFRMKLRVPDEWKGREVAAFIDTGGEACAFIGGRPYQGVDGNHQELFLLPCARGGEEFEIVVDAASTHWHSPHDSRPRIFSRAEIATRNPEVQEYWFNLELLHTLADALPEDSARRAKIVYLLNKSVDAFDYTNTDDASLRDSALAANAVLRPLLDSPACPSATDVAVHGHSHIDVAWLWPYRETRRKCARTFSTVMRLMEQYPEYIFTQSQAQLYEFTRQSYPELYEDIKQRVRDGRWDVTGSMWVEADCNLASGESLIRQILVGKNFYKDEFGVETDVLWLPDVFGYSAALPQILQKARVPYFSTIKISWSQFNAFPYNTFWWKGIDGTKVLAHFPPTGDYNAYPDPRKLLHQVAEFKEKDRCDWSLLSYGWGDGGGGPDRRHLEFLKRSKDLEGLPRCSQRKVSEFFHTIDTPDSDYPEWSGELYLELHRGTYTTQGRNKRFNRKAELLYRDAELLCTVASTLGIEYPYQQLHEKWRDILVNQFHDVIPGSSIALVYEDTDAMYPEIFAVGEGAAHAALSRIASSVETAGDGDPVVVFNTLPWERIATVSVAAPGAGAWQVIGPNGEAVPSQQNGDRVEFAARTPSMGYTTYRLKLAERVEDASPLTVTPCLLENEFLRVTLDDKAVITSILHKPSGREVLSEGSRANLLQLFEDKPNDWPAWDIDFYYDDKWEDVTGVESIEVCESGPVTAAIEIRRAFSNSVLRQRIVLRAGSPRLDFETWVDWHEDFKCLKVSFPVDVNAAKARYEIQFGNVERPTHTNTSWDVARFEVCAHRWADISEQGFGFSLMNDCKYGHHTKGNEMRLTLLRSPKDPDPHADMGDHEFTYSIMPHSGNYTEAGTVREAYGLNVPLRAVRVSAAHGSLPPALSFFSVDAPNVILETVKRAEREDAWILRLYECHNQRTVAAVAVELPFARAYECDLMEDNLRELDVAEGKIGIELKPFEILTLKLAP